MAGKAGLESDYGTDLFLLLEADKPIKTQKRLFKPAFLHSATAYCLNLAVPAWRTHRRNPPGHKGQVKDPTG